MSAKQRTKTRIQQRLNEKLASLSAQEEALCSMITTYVAEAKAKAENVLKITDTNEFLQHYGLVEQILDKAFSTCELLTATAEDMIENTSEETELETKEGNATLIAASAETQTLEADQNPTSTKSTKEDEQTHIDGESETSEESIQPEEPAKHTGEYFQDSGICEPSQDSNSTKSVQSEQPAASKQNVEVSIKESNTTSKTVPQNVKKVLKNYSEASSQVADPPSQETFEQKLENKKATTCSSPKKKKKDKSPKKKKSKSDKSVTSEVKSENKTAQSETVVKEKVPQEAKRCDLSEKNSKGSNSEITVIKSESKGDKSENLIEDAKNSIDRSETEVKSETATNNSITVDIKTEKDEIHEGAGETTEQVDKAADPSAPPVWSYNQGALLQQEVTPVVVSEIISPWCFFVQPNGHQLKNLMRDICMYMGHTGQAEPHIQTPHVGLQCLAKFNVDGAYYRAHITKTYVTDQCVTHVDVLYVDYGNKEKVKITDLRKLPDTFSQLPSQAACCALAEVAPNNKYGLWTEEDIFTFKQYVCNQQLSCIRSCSSSVAAMPILVKLIGNYPTHAMIPSQFVLQQISIGQFLVNRGSAKPIDVLEQVRLLIKNEEGKEEAAILNGSLSMSSGPRIRELSESSMNMSSIGNLLDMSGVHSNKVGDISCHGDQVSQHGNKTESVHSYGDSVENHDNKVGDVGSHGDSASCHSNKVSNISNHSDSASSHSNKASTISNHGKLNPTNQELDATSQCDKSADDKPGTNIKNEVKNEMDKKKTELDQERQNLFTKILKTAKTGVDQASIKKASSDKDSTIDKTRTSSETGSRTKRSSSETGSSERTETESKVSSTDTSSHHAGHIDSMDTTSSTTGNLQSDRSADTSFQQPTVNYDPDFSNSPQGQEIMLAHVKSPSHFYVHLVSREVGMNLDNLMKNLNKHFEKMNRRRLSNLSRTFVPLEKKLCCAQFSQDNNFYRAVIKSISKDNSGTERVLIFYMDFGDEEWVGRHRIYPLPSDFLPMPQLATCCHLAFIKPKSKADNSDDSKQLWPDSCTEFFTSLGGFEKTLHMHVVKSCLTPSKNSDEAERQLGVLLVDNTGKEEVCINLELIRQGHADLDTSSGKPTKESLELLEVWNPMEDDFLSKRNSYNIDVDDAGVATTGYKAQDDKRVCKFFSRGQECWRGDYCPYRHVRTDSGVSLDREQVYVTSGNQELLLPAVNSWVALEVTTILSPGRFYGILPLGKKSLDALGSETEQVEDTLGSVQCDENLDDLLVALNQEYSKRPSFQGTSILKAAGEIVAARFSQDQQWYRARVTQVTEDKVKVFFVDFGNSEWLPEEEVAEIKPEFLHLPFQAIECFPYKIEPAGHEETWSKEAASCFHELVDGKTLVAHIRSSSWNNCLTVELFDTSSDDDINVGDVLVQKGYAVHSTIQTESSCNVSEPSSSRRSSVSTGSMLIVPG